MDMNIKKTKITPLDYDDFEVGLVKDLKQLYFVLECDLSKPEITSFEQGILEVSYCNYTEI